MILTGIEIIAALIITLEINYSSVFIFFAGIYILVIRSKHHQKMNLILALFTFLYFSLNFLVNFIDFIWFKGFAKGYYHDDLFNQSFSFKSYQILICLIFSFLFGQVFAPFHEKIKLKPEIIKNVYLFTIPGCFLMVFCFLYELTFEQPEQRNKIFGPELTKVFVTVTTLYFLTLILCLWIDDLS